MSDVSYLLSSLRRPKLLVRAARFAVADYCRQRCLPRLFPGEGLTRHADILPKLIEREASLDIARRSGDAGYSPARHIEMLAALIVEAKAASTMTALR